ncbi:acyltransferase family protein [Halodesulfovibrio aestuarii]|uniref:Acyltransferase family protein n=1 Tax=Halodesulfovibrio aestuarii TaxID=126333 RepID=A0ABV4JQY6_9BACT
MQKQFYRRISEIDALRAIAIIGVVGSHVSSLHGGFLGVDIFFVISGYVIMLSTLQHQENGTFSLASFYNRRIRRIIPPLLCASAFIYFATLFLFVDNKDFSFIIDSYKLQSFFLHNYYFVGKSLNYFQGLTEAKLNLHLWSIAVEEQFYVVFPLLLVLATYKTKHNKFFAVLIGILSIFSIVIMLGGIGQPTFLIKALAVPEGEISSSTLRVSRYYLLYTRFWQLALGVCACLLTHSIFKSNKEIDCSKISRANNFLIFINFSTIACSMFFADITKAWPNVLSILPSVATAVLIMQFHIANGGFTSTILNARPIQTIGKLSYSLYLYHWPIYGIFKYTNSDFGQYLYDYAGYLIVLFLVSLFSYVVIEKKTQKINFKYSMVILVVFVGFHYFSSYADTPKPDVNIATIDRVVETGRYSGICKSCTSTPTKDFIVLWGDSHAQALVESLERYCLLNELDLVQLKGAPMIPNKVSHEKIKSLMVQPHFKGMILAARWSMYIKFPDDEPEESGNRYFKFNGKMPHNELEAQDVFSESFNNLLETVAGENVLILKQVPRFSFFPKKDYIMQLRGLRLRPFKKKTIESHMQDHAFVNNVFDLSRKEYPFVIVDPAPMLCPSGECKWLEDSTMLYKDDDHLSIYGVEKIFPLIEEQLDTFVKG